VTQAADVLHPAARSLYGALAQLQERVAAVVDARRAGDPDPDDRFRGLYITPAHAEHLLTTAPGGAAVAGEAPASAGAVQLDAESRLNTLRDRFELDDTDVGIVLVAAAPDLDPRFERLYAYLQDDVTRRRAGIGLALDLVGAHLGDHRARRRLHDDAPLVRGGLLIVEDGDRPVLTRSLRVPDRVIAYLLGDDTLDPRVSGLVLDCVPVDFPDAARVATALAGRLCYVRERASSAGLSFTAAALTHAGVDWIAIDAELLVASADPAGALSAAMREARLRGGPLVAGPVEALAAQHVALLRTLTTAGWPATLVGTATWDPAWSPSTPVLIAAPPLTTEHRGGVWRAALDGELARGVDPGATTTQFRLTPEQIRQAAHAAAQQAQLDGGPVTAVHLHAGARSRNAAGLEHLARRIEPRMGWDDLVLPADRLGQLRELVARARHRDLVLDEWGMGRSAKGRGLTGLFVGESGTGKTLSAEIIAGALGLDLYVIDLSTVIDKYVGETEKNLERIFTEADRVNGVLLFDEADAIFGKRSEVRDAHDRYANVETAYLLQRMERFDGLALLTTNLRSNVDEAFTRRLDVIIDFPFPDDEDRGRLWELNVRRGVPLADDLDLSFLARAFRLAGGNIRNIVFTAAYLAAEDGGRLTMAHLIRGTQREYRKMGRLCVPEEFGLYYHLIADTRT
jgi:hypothetical protein